MKKIVMLLFVSLLSFPLLANAGWRDVLDATERVDKLIVNRPARTIEQTAPEYSGEAPVQNHEMRTAPRSGEDAHFIQPDDYFVAEQELGDHTYIYVTLSKMITKPSTNTKDEGEFMGVRSGKNKWSGFFWNSRIAAKNELKLGMIIILYEDNSKNSVYQAPVKKDRARGGRWFMAKITDMSDMYKGYVTTSGNYKVGLNNIRIPVAYTE